MYKSALDPRGALTFPFDPLRALHADKSSPLQWPEFPYKQVVLDRVTTKAVARGWVTPSIEAVAGALLSANGDEALALFELEQHHTTRENGSTSADTDSGVKGWGSLESRFLSERAAFREAKRLYLKQQKAAVSGILDGIANRKQAEAEQKEHKAWKERQIIKRYPNGSKYDGDGVIVNGVQIPHGHGTLWVPEKPMYGTNQLTDIKRVPRYVGTWMDGLKHGHGTYYWATGESWCGHFVRDEMQGKGTFTTSVGDESNEKGAQRIRYYNRSQPICWGDELMPGCRVRLFENYRAESLGDFGAVALRDENATDGYGETDYVIVEYDSLKDRHRLRKAKAEDIRWVSLQDKSFQVVSMRPVTRLEASWGM